MIRKTFENELQEVKDDILVLGSMVEEAILASVDALKKRDLEAARDILKADREVILNKAVNVMDVAKAAGAGRLCLATEKGL